MLASGGIPRQVDQIIVYSIVEKGAQDVVMLTLSLQTEIGETIKIGLNVERPDVVQVRLTEFRQDVAVEVRLVAGQRRLFDFLCLHRKPDVVVVVLEENLRPAGFAQKRMIFFGKEPVDLSVLHVQPNDGLMKLRLAAA